MGRTFLAGFPQLRQVRGDYQQSLHELQLRGPERSAGAGSEYAVVAHPMEPLGRGVLEIARHEITRGQRAGLELPGAMIAVAEYYSLVVSRNDAAFVQRPAAGVARQVADDILRSFPAGAAVHDPAAFLRRFRHPHPRQGRPGFAEEDGTVYSRQSADGNQELGIKNPDGVVRMHHQSRYKAVDMRMPRQRPSPGVKGDHHADVAPEPVLYQDGQRLRRGLHRRLAQCLLVARISIRYSDGSGNVR